jgi:allantoin racemase
MLSDTGRVSEASGAPGPRRIAFINPFGTAAYDELIRETLDGTAAPGTDLDIFSIKGAPENIDYYWPKHIAETAVFNKVLELADVGYDAFIVGCCYDPGVRVARELTDIPVVGPLEASLNMASYFGHSCTVVTDHRKALPYLEDLVRLYGSGNCRSVRCIDWWITDMIENPAGVAKDAADACMAAILEDKSEVAILGCTIIGGCLSKHIRATGEFRELPIVNPNVLALKTAEALADLYRQGLYRISRRGFYQKHDQHNAEEAERIRRRYGPAGVPNPTGKGGRNGPQH